jgi:putative membrane protein
MEDTMPNVRWLLVAGLSVATIGCSKDEPQTNTMPPAASQGGEATPDVPQTQAVQPTAEPVAMPATPVTDAQIAKISDTVDSGEIEQANVASSRARNDRVKQFAQHMIEQHTASKEKGAALVHSAQITPETSSISSRLQTDGMQMVQSLKAADATSFDTTYIAGQIQEHQQVLNLLTTQLIPSATSDDLKQALQSTRAMVERHIAEAKSIQQSLTNQR